MICHQRAKANRGLWIQLDPLGFVSPQECNQIQPPSLENARWNMALNHILIGASYQQLWQRLWSFKDLPKMAFSMVRPHWNMTQQVQPVLLSVLSMVKKCLIVGDSKCYWEQKCNIMINKTERVFPGSVKPPTRQSLHMSKILCGNSQQTKLKVSRNCQLHCSVISPSRPHSCVSESYCVTCLCPTCVVS